MTKRRPLEDGNAAATAGPTPFSTWRPAKISRSEPSNHRRKYLPNRYAGNSGEGTSHHVLRPASYRLYGRQTRWSPPDFSATTRNAWHKLSGFVPGVTGIVVTITSDQCSS